ncbi:A-type ATP synthase subunit F [Methanocella paludicola SANAE]|uniref:A-type ATP synthase subunit F n=1 Tax=Methanocella paludicola (strain DSM 17711 / JCM 13418 / NBRC 101707 / SANAE) TaxID=304371 RepID=D1Z0Y9_METPS|nr:V-type ATP synthase subunit F [Methanocella paludicola]BAI62361.1 A-type ATP synthase subunit F [Methanocella paludicola SANAE]
MHRFVVVTDRDSAIGFRLAGVDAFEASGPQEAREVISSLVKKGDTGIMAVNEELLSSLDEKFRDGIEKMRSPIVISIPSRTVGLDKRSYIERLLRKAIGYNVVMRR